MDSNLGSADMLNEKWAPVINHPDMPVIEDNYKRTVTSVLLENQEKALRESNMLNETPNNAVNGGLGLAAANGNANMQGYDPILISLVRRAMPNLMAYDVCGVQPMTGPTGLIFAMRAKYDGQDKVEALFNEAVNASGGVTTAFSDIGDVVGSNSEGSTVDPLEGLDPYSRSGAEALSGTAFPQMAFSIERTAVEAKSRALKAEYTTELAQDLKAVHGLDAESELANILSSEILAEINREVMRTIYKSAKLGAQQIDLASRAPGTTSTQPGAGGDYGIGVSGGTGADAIKSSITGATNTFGRGIGGVYDLNADSDGRWSAERFRGLMFQIERECNQIAKDTRRGKGNFIIVSSDVASALAMGGFLNISPALNQSLNVDDTGNTFAGVLNGKIKVYIDPYAGPGVAHTAATDAGRNFVCVGYKGTSAYDAGLFYCPYVPLQMVRAVGEDNFQPKIGFKTRYGLVNNPFVTTNTGVADPTSASNNRQNQYYRIFRVDNLHGNS